MEAERQPVAGSVDGVADLGQPVGAIADDVQDRPEHLPLQYVQTRQLKGSRCNKVPRSHSGASVRSAMVRYEARIRVLWASSATRASSSITGPTSVE